VPVDKNLITTPEVATILKVNPEIIVYLRKKESLPFIKHRKFILFNKDEVIRWRNQRLATDSVIIIHLPTYYLQISLNKFCTYEHFKNKMEERAFVDNDSVIQYIKRYNIWKEIKDVVGDIVSSYHMNLKPKCVKCGGIIHSYLDTNLCSICKKRGAKV